jgi:ABC-type sugar transport system ATPase subunit
VGQHVRSALDLVKLGDLGTRSAARLSGGQQQRVALARAFVFSPAVLLFDEPLSNLDAELRVQMRAEITALHKRLGTTMIYVTHDQVEAMTMADRIVVLRGGRVEQVGSPLELYNRPANRFVAGFIGSPQMNFLGGSVASAGADEVRIALDAAPDRAAQTAWPLRPAQAAAEHRVWLGIRPEHIRVDAPPTSAQPLTVTIERIEQLGAASFLYCSLPSGEKLTVHAPGQVAHDVGARITVHIPVVDAHVFDTAAGELAFSRR